MDYKAFSREMDKEVKKMNQLELSKLTMDLLRHVPANRKDMILESIVHKNSEDSLSSVYVKKEYERVMKLCKIIAAGEKSIKGTSCEYNEYHSYEYGYEDDSITYEDGDDIGGDLRDALESANWMLLRKEYKYAEDIYDAVCTVIISIEYDEDCYGCCDEQSEFTFDEFIDEMNPHIPIHKVAIETLYAVYMNTDKINRANRLYRHYAWDSKFPIKLEQLPLAEVLCKDMIIPQIETTSLNLDEKESKTIMVFKNQWGKVGAELRENKKSVGWTYDLKGLIVPLFLIVLADVNKITPLMEHILKGIKGRLDYSMQLDDMEFIEYYKLWRSSVVFTEEENRELYSWCKNEVTNRVREIVSNKYRNAYSRAAEISQLLSEVAFYIEKTTSKDEIALRHKSAFPRHSAFRAEYASLPK
ncbi:hypothetical protein JYT99_03255 [bacterium AH-315-E09]|nr:hypothetical protein [bacterium AH-315-L21]MBN4069705.1 hypothetical protein [bacterium AH-315-G05]MBN4074928.1 hypothetical protein [bacterium AH-315-E09]